MVEYLNVWNSPRFNFKLEDMLNLTMRFLTIKADIFKQVELLKLFNKWDLELKLPMFPFNTGTLPATLLYLVVFSTLFKLLYLISHRCSTLSLIH